MQNDRLAAVRNRSTTASESPAPESSAPNPEAFNISAPECIRRLRAKGEPILLFGETEKDRRLRLRALELLDERGGKQGGHNEFKKALEEAQKAMEYREIDDRAKGKARGGDDVGSTQDGAGSARRKRDEVEVLDLELVKTEPRKVYPLIYYALKVSFNCWIHAVELLVDRAYLIEKGVAQRLGRLPRRTARYALFIDTTEFQRRLTSTSILDRLGQTISPRPKRSCNSSTNGSVPQTALQISPRKGKSLSIPFPKVSLFPC